MAYTKAQICNMGLSNIGLRNVVSDIDTPTNDAEEIFGQYYDLVLRKCLKRERPQFALYDEEIASQVFVDDTLHFLQPSEALEIVKVNGFTEGWTIEHGEIIPDGIILDYTRPLPIKYVRYLTDTGLYPDEWVELLSWELIGYCAGRLTQDSGMLQLAATGAKGARDEYQTINLRSAKPRLKTKRLFDSMWRR